MNAEPDPLREHLADDAASPEEAAALLPALRALAAWPAPTATPAATQQLLARLQLAPAAAAARPHGWRWMALLLRSQIPLVRQELWLGSAVVYVIGLLVTLAPNLNPGQVETLPFVLLAPAIAAVGCAFLFGPDNDDGVELTLALPVSPRLLLLARLTLLLGFDLVLGLLGSVALAALRTEVALWPLVLAWLAPMAFLAALGFFLSVVMVEPLAGILLSLGAWAVWVLGPVWIEGALRLSLPARDGPPERLTLLGLAVLLGALALWLGGREERWLPRSEAA